MLGTSLIDWSSISTAATGETAGATAIGITIMGILVAIGVAIKIFKKFRVS